MSMHASDRSEVLSYLMSKPEMKQLWRDVNSERETWIDTLINNEINSESNEEFKNKLGKLYGLKDIFVKRFCETNIVVKGGSSEIHFNPIDNKERDKMKNKYRSIHLHGLEINCQPYVARGSKGFVIISIYDERYVNPKDGFLGMVAFNLGDKASTIPIEIDYCISSQDGKNWVAIVTVYDHGLNDNYRPCNIIFKSIYKYSNNIERFQQITNHNSQGSKTFHIPIKYDNKVLVQTAVRNALDYSSAFILDKKFLQKLSEREIQSLINRRVLSNFPDLREISNNIEEKITRIDFSVNEIGETSNNSKNPESEVNVSHLPKLHCSPPRRSSSFVHKI